ncbi:MAG: hypothetical protein N4A71_22285 [Carboxylicivirga sp.]|jgi:hypothetical protein|nr:hypothetical protein [Carboxylicivirga sp.]
MRAILIIIAVLFAGNIYAQQENETCDGEWMIGDDGQPVFVLLGDCDTDPGCAAAQYKYELKRLAEIFEERVYDWPLGLFPCYIESAREQLGDAYGYFMMAHHIAEKAYGIEYSCLSPNSTIDEYCCEKLSDSYDWTYSQDLQGYRVNPAGALVFYQQDILINPYCSGMIECPQCNAEVPGDQICPICNRCYDCCDCVEDCAGVKGGSAYIDNCGDCVGGTTGLSPCEQEICECCQQPIDQCICNKCPHCHKLLPQLGQASLKSGNSSCELCTCSVNATATITASKNIAEFGDQYDITISFSCDKPEVVPYNVKIDVTRGDGYVTLLYVDIAEGINQAIVDILGEYENFRILGTTNYKVTYNYRHNNQEYIATDDCIVTHMGAKHDKIRTKHYLAMYNLWMEAVGWCLNNTGSKIEYGFTFNQQLENGEVERVRFNGSPSSCGSPVTTVNLNTIKDLKEITVGSYHTHPPLTTCASNVKATTTGPSNPDKTNLSWLASFVWDYNVPVNQLIGGHDPMLPNKLYEFGQRRVTP